MTHNGQVGFSIGNGKSRLPLNLEPLRAKGTVVGCGALYRDFSPDYLVAVDQGIISEIKQNYNGKFVYRPQEQNQPEDELVIDDGDFTRSFINDFGFASGPTSLYILAEYFKATVIYMIGHDCRDILGFNNVYVGTENYHKDRNDSGYYGNFIQQVCSVVKSYPQVMFLRVIPTVGYSIPQFDELYNMFDVFPQKMYAMLEMTHVDEK